MVSFTDDWIPPPKPAVPKTPFTRELLSGFENSNADIRKLQFFLSDELVLESEDIFEDYQVERDGKGIRQVKNYPDKITIPQDAPGVLKRFTTLKQPGPESGIPILWVSFDERNDRNMLMFTLDPEDGCYYPAFEEDPSGNKTVLYANKEYIITWRTLPKLLITLEKRTDLNATTHILRGRKIEDAYQGDEGAFF